MTLYSNVLAVTKRTAELCATQALLRAAGYKLVVATNMVAARSMIKTLQIKAVIVCRSSWTSEEVQDIATELTNAIEIPVLMHCPGCTGCDQVAGTPGTLRDVTPLRKLITAVRALKA